MRRIVFAVAMSLAANTGVAGTAPKGCYEKTWSKSELKKLPQQMVTAIRLEGNVGPLPETKPHAYGRLMARFRDTGEVWLATPYECNDTGAGYACATYCDGNIFVLSAGSKGLQVLPPAGIGLYGNDCSEAAQLLQMNADQIPFALARLGSKACPER